MASDVGKVYLRRTVGRRKSSFGCLALSPDDQWLAAGADDGCVLLFEVETGRRRVLAGSDVEVRSLAWSPDGQRLVSGAVGGVRIWDVAAGTQEEALEGRGEALSVAWSPDGKLLACGSWGGDIRVWDMGTRREVAALRDIGPVRAVAWSPDGRWLASGGAGKLLLWPVGEWSDPRAFEGHTHLIRAMAFSPPDGKLLASGSDDHTTRIWDATAGHALKTFGGHGCRVNGLAWSPEGTRLAYALDDGTILLRDVAAGKPEPMLEGHSDAVSGVAWSREGGWLASSGRDSTIRLWNAANGEQLKIMPGPAGAGYASWSPGGDKVAWATPKKVRVWEAARPENVAALSSSSGVGSLAWAPDGDLIAAGLGRDVAVWQVSVPQSPVRVLKGHSEPVQALAWSPNGVRLASATSHGKLFVWAVATGECTRVLEGHTMAWSADGRWLVSASRPRLRLWDADTGQDLRSFIGHESEVKSVALAPDGLRVASGSHSGSVGIWQMETMTAGRKLEGHRTPVISLTWSSDGQLLASMSWDCEVRLWRVSDGALLDVLPGLPYRYVAGELAFVGAPSERAIYGDEEVEVEGWAPLLGQVRATETVVSAKVAFVGESEAGKSCLAMRFANDRYEALPTTHGMQIWPVSPQSLDSQATTSEGETREVVLWDLGGQRHYQLVHQLFLPDTRLALVLLDPTRGPRNFEEVEDWNRRLARAGGDIRKLLVRSKADLGGVVDERRLNELIASCKFDDYLEVSAKTKQGVAELGKRMLELVGWDTLVKVTRTEEFQAVHDQIAEARRREKCVLFERDLRRDLERAGSKAEQGDINTVVGQLSRQGQLVDMRAANRERVLVLRVDVVDKYAGSLILLAQAHPRGVPVLELRSLVLIQDFPGMTDAERVSGAEERIVLESIADLFVARGIAIQHAGLLVFPSEFPKAQAPDISEVPHRKPLYYDFDGPIDNIWASLTANVAVSGEFGPVRLWANRAEYEQTGRGVFGMYLREVRRGCGHLDVYFSEQTEEKQRDLFITYVDDHLRQHGVRLAERLGITCSCGEVLKEEWFRSAFARGESELKCPQCGTAYPVLGGAEAVRDKPGVAKDLRALKTRIEEGTRRAAEETKRNVEQAAASGDGPIRLLHLSDLHFTGTEGVWGLLQPLASDLRDSLKTERLDYIVVSGDFAHQCQDLGFDRAEEFLKELIREFKLSADRLVLCPGNHDLNRGLKVYAYEEQRPAGYSDAEVVKLAEGGFLVRDPSAYPKRFERFGKMYHNLLQRPYPARLEEQGVVIPYPETGLEFLTLNTAWEIDGRFPDRASVNLEAMGKALTQVGRPVVRRMRIVVWHHAVRAQRQVANQQVISQLVKAGYRLCLHGDIHEEAAEVVGLHVVGTGSFGAGGEGTPRLYSLLEVDRDFGRVVVHMRAQRKAGGAFGPHAVVGTDDADRAEGRYEIPL